MNARSDPSEGKSSVLCRAATLEDLESIVAIHKMCFTPATHALMHLGDDFLRATYRWLITSKIAFTVVAEKDSAIVGFQSGCDRPYRGALFRDNIGALLMALCSRPWIVARLQVLDSLRSSLPFTQGRKDIDRTVPAQLVINGVHPKHRLGFEVANQLLVATLACGRSRGWTRLIGGVYKKNVVILFLCKLHGFKRIDYLDTDLRCFVEYRFGAGNT
jgi:hypothetical protein